MTTIEQRKQNHEEHMEKHFKKKMQALALKNIGFSCQEIAYEMGVPESTVRALLKEVNE